MIHDIQKITNSLTRVYEILEFTPDEIKDAISDLGKAQQLAVAAELLKSLTANEAKAISDAAQKTDEEKRALMERIAKTRAADEDFKSRAQEAAKKVLDEHIAHLKSGGDGEQKETIVRILKEIE